ncbi:hypothetical protein A2U01_0001429 [Trifolium medium]|uniref:Uncharacterized protein n=1 Tax=Trifolium medium TaxID=97028 RepID=A0A392M0Y6_9FABA|nr:hypothetical protein [Trifolium medium]
MNPGLARIHVLVFIWDDECSLSENDVSPSEDCFPETGFFCSVFALSSLELAKRA